jgi:hypothetical protein
LEPGGGKDVRLDEAEALAMNIRDLIPEAGREEALAVLRQFSRAEVIEPYRMQRIAKDGRIVDVWLTATALVNDSGSVYAIATTERKAQSEHDSGRHPLQSRTSSPAAIRQAPPKQTPRKLCAGGRRRSR